MRAKKSRNRFSASPDPVRPPPFSVHEIWVDAWRVVDACSLPTILPGYNISNPRKREITVLTEDEKNRLDGRMAVWKEKELERLGTYISFLARKLKMAALIEVKPRDGDPLSWKRSHEYREILKAMDGPPSLERAEELLLALYAPDEPGSQDTDGHMGDEDMEQDMDRRDDDDKDDASEGESEMAAPSLCGGDYDMGPSLSSEPVVVPPRQSDDGEGVNGELQSPHPTHISGSADDSDGAGVSPSHAEGLYSIRFLDNAGEGRPSKRRRVHEPDSEVPSPAQQLVKWVSLACRDDNVHVWEMYVWVSVLLYISLSFLICLQPNFEDKSCDWVEQRYAAEDRPVVSCFSYEYIPGRVWVCTSSPSSANAVVSALPWRVRERPHRRVSRVYGPSLLRALERFESLWTVPEQRALWKKSVLDIYANPYRSRHSSAKLQALAIQQRHKIVAGSYVLCLHDNMQRGQIGRVRLRQDDGMIKFIPMYGDYSFELGAIPIASFVPYFPFGQWVRVTEGVYEGMEGRVVDPKFLPDQDVKISIDDEVSERPLSGFVYIVCLVVPVRKQSDMAVGRYYGLHPYMVDSDDDMMYPDLGQEGCWGTEEDVAMQIPPSNDPPSSNGDKGPLITNTFEDGEIFYARLHNDPRIGLQVKVRLPRDFPRPCYLSYEVPPVIDEDRGRSRSASYSAPPMYRDDDLDSPLSPLVQVSDLDPPFSPVWRPDGDLDSPPSPLQLAAGASSPPGEELELLDDPPTPTSEFNVEDVAESEQPLLSSTAKATLATFAREHRMKGRVLSVRSVDDKTQTVMATPQNDFATAPAQYRMDCLYDVE